MAEIKIDVRGQTCPAPLVEVRKAIKKATVGDVIEITGTHSVSKKEIPMAMKSLGLEILNIKEENGIWTIRIKR